jgi:hypothetical protein
MSHEGRWAKFGGATGIGVPLVYFRRGGNRLIKFDRSTFAVCF